MTRLEIIKMLELRITNVNKCHIADAEALNALAVAIRLLNDLHGISE